MSKGPDGRGFTCSPVFDGRCLHSWKPGDVHGDAVKTASGGTAQDSKGNFGFCSRVADRRRPQDFLEKRTSRSIARARRVHLRALACVVGRFRHTRSAFGGSDKSRPGDHPRRHRSAHGSSSHSVVQARWWCPSDRHGMFPSGDWWPACWRSNLQPSLMMNAHLSSTHCPRELERIAWGICFVQQQISTAMPPLWQLLLQSANPRANHLIRTLPPEACCRARCRRVEDSVGTLGRDSWHSRRTPRGRVDGKSPNAHGRIGIVVRRSVRCSSLLGIMGRCTADDQPAQSKCR